MYSEAKYTNYICKGLPGLAASTWEPAFYGLRDREGTSGTWQDVQVALDVCIQEARFVLCF